MSEKMIEVDVELDIYIIAELALEAHRRDIKLNELIVEILKGTSEKIIAENEELQ